MNGMTLDRVQWQASPVFILSWLFNDADSIETT
jgi:hypothetical protein